MGVDIERIGYEQLSLEQRDALDEALKALEYAYNPYSHFFVGAALISVDGSIISGTNFENAAYGSTICAERAAVLRANSAGVRKFKSIAIIARKKDAVTTEVTAPCGACRQVLFEVSQISKCDLEVILSTTSKEYIVRTTISKLLPRAFGPDSVGADIAKFRGE